MNTPFDPPSPWSAPEPGTHWPFHEPPYGSATDVAPESGAAASRRHRHHVVAIVACVLGFLLGVGGALVAVELNRSDSHSAAPTTPSVSTLPTVTSPSNGSATPATTPTDPTTTAPGASTTKTGHTLTTGLVMINTVLGYEDAQAAGTGIVLTADGDILTNNHVVDGSTKITVTIVTTGKTYDATVVGTDKTDDIAVIHATNASGLAVAPLGTAGGVEVGDAVSAIGNAGGTGSPTTTTGTVVALDQTITASDGTGTESETLHGLIQMSAQLQPGDSGGPLYDADGKVIGINTAGNSSGFFPRRRRGGTTASTEGYAITIDTAVRIAKQIQAGQASDTVIIGTPPLLGVSVSDSNTTGVDGVVVAGVASGTGADKIGLQAGDVITKIDDTTIASTDDLTTALRAHQVGDSVKVTWDSEGTSHTATATLIAGPAD